MRHPNDIMADLIASGLTVQQIALMAELQSAAAVEAVRAPAETPEERKKRVSRETSQRHRASLRVTDASPEVRAQDVTARHQTSPNVTPVSPPHVRVLDNNLTKVLTGSDVDVDVEARAGDTDDWPKVKNLADYLAEQIESPWLDPHKTLALAGSGNLILAWKRAGASWEHDVLPVIGAICRSRKSPVGSWSYFDKPILQSVADSRKALALPEARSTGPPSGITSLTDRIADEHARARKIALNG